MLLLLAVFLTGGSSREDVASVPLLRFLAACAAGIAVLLVTRADLSRIKWPLILLGSIFLLAMIQLAPLPPALWSELPERENIILVDSLIGLDVWRPITLSSTATLNAAASLIVPLAAVLLFSATRDVDFSLLAFALMGVLSACIGLLQIFSSDQSGFYFYELMSRGSPTGLFPNRNHQAVFLSCCVMICFYLARGSFSNERKTSTVVLGTAALLMGMVVIINSSRAGLIALLVAVVMCAGSLVAARQGEPENSPRTIRSFVLPGALLVAASLIAGIFIAAQRVPALSRLLENSAFEDLRAQLLPRIAEMALDFQPWGAGLGTFEYAYRMREPVELLFPSYVNEAHNDWLQFIIEGGAPGTLIILASCLLALRRLGALTIAMRRQGPNRSASWLGLGILLILGGGSLVDYPLRTPSIMALGIIALAIFVQPNLSATRSGRRPGDQQGGL